MNIWTLNLLRGTGVAFILASMGGLNAQPASNAGHSKTTDNEVGNGGLSNTAELRKLLGDGYRTENGRFNVESKAYGTKNTPCVISCTLEGTEYNPGQPLGQKKKSLNSKVTSLKNLSSSECSNLAKKMSGPLKDADMVALIYKNPQQPNVAKGKHSFSGTRTCEFDYNTSYKFMTTKETHHESEFDAQGASCAEQQAAEIMKARKDSAKPRFELEAASIRLRQVQFPASLKLYQPATEDGPSDTPFYYSNPERSTLADGYYALDRDNVLDCSSSAKGDKLKANVTVTLRVDSSKSCKVFSAKEIVEKCRDPRKTNVED
jgi:hypothetical protein